MGDLFFKKGGMLCHFHLFLYGHPCLKTGAVGDAAFHGDLFFKKREMLCIFQQFLFGHLCSKTVAVGDVAFFR